MKSFAKYLVLSAALAALTPLAKASSLNTDDNLQLGGMSGTTSASGIQFTSQPLYVNGSDQFSAFGGDLGGFVCNGCTGGSFLSFSTGSGVTLFTLTSADGKSVLTFQTTGTAKQGVSIAGVGNNLAYYQLGTLTLTVNGVQVGQSQGFVDVAGDVGGFYIGSSMVSSTPEPSSLLLLGTGLVGAAGAFIRKRSIV